MNRSVIKIIITKIKPVTPKSYINVTKQNYYQNKAQISRIICAIFLQFYMTSKFRVQNFKNDRLLMLYR